MFGEFCMVTIQERLVEFNPWWKEAFTLEFRQRKVYGEIRKFHKLPQIVALTGLRRVGKSTLLKKIVHDEIAVGKDPKAIMYKLNQGNNKVPTAADLAELKTKCEKS